MEVMKSLVLLTCLFAFAKSAEEGESGARLLISKQILNKYIVQDMDLIVKYTLYNIGNNAALNVILSDSSFSPEVFALAGGHLNATINRIPPGTNVSHTVVLRPVRVGPYNFTAAEVHYKSSEETLNAEVQVAVSSEPGEGYIVAFRDYDKKFSPHLLDWGAFAVMTLPSLAIPFLLWWSSKSKYETISSKNKKGAKE